MISLYSLKLQNLLVWAPNDSTSERKTSVLVGKPRQILWPKDQGVDVHHRGPRFTLGGIYVFRSSHGVVSNLGATRLHLDEQTHDQRETTQVNMQRSTYMGLLRNKKLDFYGDVFLHHGAIDQQKAGLLWQRIGGNLLWHPRTPRASRHQRVSVLQKSSTCLKAMTLKFILNGFWFKMFKENLLEILTRDYKGVLQMCPSKTSRRYVYLYIII